LLFSSTFGGPEWLLLYAAPCSPCPTEGTHLLCVVAQRRRGSRTYQIRDVTKGCQVPRCSTCSLEYLSAWTATCHVLSRVSTETIQVLRNGPRGFACARSVAIPGNSDKTEACIVNSSFWMVVGDVCTETLSQLVGPDHFAEQPDPLPADLDGLRARKMDGEVYTKGCEK